VLDAGSTLTGEGSEVGLTFNAQIETVLGELRPILQADGADLELRVADEAGRQVTLGLVLDGVECLECVMPPEILQLIVAQAMQDRVQDVQVVLEDPREP
jgi:Fe-S cluster biogenesis protein NfuA